LEGQVTPDTKPRRVKPAHLMCGMPLWGIAAAILCSYLAYVSYAHVRQGEFTWSHDILSIVTYGVWVVLIAGLISETSCLRERLFFVLVFPNFSLGFVLAVWADAPLEMEPDGLSVRTPMAEGIRHGPEARQGEPRVFTVIEATYTAH